ASFPLTVATTDSIGALEVLVEDSTATVVGAGLAHRAPVTAEGHTFQRFLGENVPPAATFTVATRGQRAMSHTVYFAIVVGLAGVALLVGLARSVIATGGVRVRRSVQPDRANALAHQIAALDARFERERGASGEQRAAYQAEREALKLELGA